MIPEKTLGISLGHDSGVALLENDQILFAANEERFTRVKGQSGFPFKSLGYLQKIGLADSLTRIAVDGKLVSPHGNDAKYRFEGNSGGLQGKAESLGLDALFLGNKLGIHAIQAIYSFSHLEKRRRQIEFVREITRNREVAVHRVDHHIAHASSIAFPGNPMETGLVITLDGIGEGICSRVFRFNKGKLVKVGFTPALGSPALMYGYATKILGYRINRHEGKLTGLAAYGNAQITEGIFSKHFRYEKGKFKAVRIGYGIKALNKLAQELHEFSPEDIAAGAQKVLEENVTSWIKDLTNRFNESRLYLSGGAFANVKLNQRIAQLPSVTDLIISPNMGDGGLALGTAVSVHKQNLALSSLYLGSNIKSYSETNHELELIYSGEDFHELIARMIAEKKIVAIARGRMEYGPRALGNRSILYSAKDTHVNQWLNKMLNRTEFMPFAPTCRDVDCKRNFLLDLPIDRYKHMTVTCDVTEFCKETAPAVVHVDGTARPQIVFRDDNPDLYKILECYSQYVDNPVVVNTSFNMHEEPIVRTEQEAISALKRSNIDYLLLGNQLYRNSLN